MALGGYLCIYVDEGKWREFEKCNFPRRFCIEKCNRVGRNIVEFAAKVNRLLGGS